MEQKTIHKYVSSSGLVADYLIHQVDHNGYLQLVKDSIKRIDTLLKLETDELHRQALNELRESYVKSVNGEHPKRNYTYLDGVEYLTGCVIDKIHIISRPEPSPNKRGHRSPLTALKAEYRKSLPISRYYGSFKLDIGKYEDVTDGEDTSIDWEDLS